MAIDTAEKRRSVAGILGYLWGPGVTPSASHDADWRQEAGYGYVGVPVAVAAVVASMVWSGLSGLTTHPVPWRWWIEGGEDDA